MPITDNDGEFPELFGRAAAAAPFQRQDLSAMKTLLDQINVSGGNVARTLTSGFASAAASGKSFNDTLASIAQTLAKTALKAGAQSLGQGLVAGLGSLLSGAFGGGTIAPFADGGVVASPTFFGNGSSTGLMGERGAEAILPLARGANGQLGVVAQGAGASPVSVTVNIAARDVDSFRRSEAQIAGALARAVARGQRNL